MFKSARISRSTRFLGARQLEGELLKELVEGLADLLKPNARQVLGDLVLVLKQTQLEQEQLFKAQPGLGRLRVFRTLGAVDEFHGLGPAQQLHLGHHAGGQRFSQRGVTCDTTFRMSLASPALFNPWRASFSVLGYTGVQPVAPRISNWVRSSTSGWAMLHLPLYNLGLP